MLPGNEIRVPTSGKYKLEGITLKTLKNAQKGFKFEKGQKNLQTVANENDRGLFGRNAIAYFAVTSGLVDISNIETTDNANGTKNFEVNLDKELTAAQIAKALGMDASKIDDAFLDNMRRMVDKEGNDGSYNHTKTGIEIDELTVFALKFADEKSDGAINGEVFGKKTPKAIVKEVANLEGAEPEEYSGEMQDIRTTYFGPVTSAVNAQAIARQGEEINELNGTIAQHTDQIEEHTNQIEGNTNALTNTITVVGKNVEDIATANNNIYKLGLKTNYLNQQVADNTSAIGSNVDNLNWLAGNVQENRTNILLTNQYSIERDLVLGLGVGTALNEVNRAHLRIDNHNAQINDLQRSKIWGAEKYVTRQVNENVIPALHTGKELTGSAYEKFQRVKEYSITLGQLPFTGFSGVAGSLIKETITND